MERNYLIPNLQQTISWIDVHSMMPETGLSVLICADGMMTGKAFLNSDKKWATEDGAFPDDEQHRINYWMPMPKPICALQSNFRAFYTSTNVFVEVFDKNDTVIGTFYHGDPDIFKLIYDNNSYKTRLKFLE